MRFQTLTLGLLCLFLFQCVFENDACAQGKRKKGGKRNKSIATDPYVEGQEGDSEGKTEEPAKEGEAVEGAVEGEAETAPEDASQAPDENGKSINERLNEDESGGGLRRSGRMEFDERLIKGQAAKSGAVYLFKRMPRHLPGLVPMRRSYRTRIVEPILGKVTLKPAQYSYEAPEENPDAVKKEEVKPPEVSIKEPETAAPPPPVPVAQDEQNGKHNGAKKKKK